MLKQRLLTAFILIPLTLLVLYYLPPLPFGILITFITLGGAWEWTNLMGITRTSRRCLYLACVTAVIAICLFVPVFFIFTVGFVWWLAVLVLLAFYPRGAACWSKNRVVSGIMGCLVLVPCWAAINYIRNESDGLYALLFLFILIWGADSIAYFVGKKWGKHKLAPQISPGKSIEGLIGAIIFSLAIAVAALFLFRPPYAVWPWAGALILFTALFSVVGDLFESMVKRQAGVKDSGKLLPGHGGLLDRIDSLTAAAPIFVFGSLLLTKYLGP